MKHTLFVSKVNIAYAVEIVLALHELQSKYTDWNVKQWQVIPIGVVERTYMVVLELEREIGKEEKR